MARTARWTKPGRIPRTASQMTVVLVGLFLSAGLRADEPLQAEIDFKPVYSLPVVELATSQGKIRLVVDTASNFTSLLRAPKCLKVRLAGQEIRLRPVPIQTRVFAGFKSPFPPLIRWTACSEKTFSVMASPCDSISGGTRFSSSYSLQEHPARSKAVKLTGEVRTGRSADTTHRTARPPK